MKKDVLIYTGGENFAEIINNGAYYVDKTSYLKPLFITSTVKNPLFIRPRRFGKTLNLSMIKEFCELNYQNPYDKSYQQKLFIDNGRNLAVAGDDYEELREKIMGQFPVISISFKGVEGLSFKSAVEKLILKIAEQYDKFSFLSNSAKQDPDDIKNFNDIKLFCKTEQENLHEKDKLSVAVSICGSFIAKLGSMLFKEYERPVIVMIDEYDVPLQKAVVAKEPYYEEMLEIIKQISISTFKQDPDPWLYKGIVSGCLKIAHQSVFTDANNFRIYGMESRQYDGFFGFTEDETRKLLSDCGLMAKETEVKDWYDGYRFGDRHIFCPWSLTNYCDEALHNDDSLPKPFWVNTSGNDIIALFARNSIEARDAGNIDKLQRLLDGDSVEITLREFSTYPDIIRNLDFDVFMTMLLHTGYVTIAKKSGVIDKVSVRIPNREVSSCFADKYESLYSKDNAHWFRQSMNLVDMLLENKTEESQVLISSMLKQFLSIRNSGSELYYHGFMSAVLGFASSVKGIEYYDEAEKGDGFTDIVLNNESSDTVVILELKKARNERLSRIEMAKAAACQILDKKYAESYIKQQYKYVYAIGIGFGGKECAVLSLGNLAERNNLKKVQL